MKCSFDIDIIFHHKKNITKFLENPLHKILKNCIYKPQTINLTTQPTTLKLTSYIVTLFDDFSYTSVSNYLLEDKLVPSELDVPQHHIFDFKSAIQNFFLMKGPGTIHRKGFHDHSKNTSTYVKLSLG